MAEFFDLVVDIKKNVFVGGVAAKVITGAVMQQKYPQRIAVQSGYLFNPGGWTAEINVIIFFFLREAPAQPAFFLLVFP